MKKISIYPSGAVVVSAGMTIEPQEDPIEVYQIPEEEDFEKLVGDKEAIDKLTAKLTPILSDPTIKSNG